MVSCFSRKRYNIEVTNKMTEVKAMTKFYDVTFQELSGRSVVKQKSLQTENHLTSGKMLVQAILKQN